MKVLKFGGTSVGSAERIKGVAQLVISGDPKLVVLSAMSGTTNALVEISQLLYDKRKDEANKQIDALEKQYEGEIAALYATEEYLAHGKELLKGHFDFIRSFTLDMFTLYEERAILAQGELMSTAMLHYYLREQGVNSVLLAALDFMKLNLENEPDKAYISTHLHDILKDRSGADIYITQGYICRNQYGEIDNLKRGGSDYTASLIGEAINAEEIQIWTDIDGMHNNDPRIVDNTQPISQLSFDEAAELAYFGAKILHPSSVRPAADANIPVRLKNTLDPDAAGTLISSEVKGDGIKAIAAKDGITAVKIKSGRMLLAYGFLRRVFEVFETYKTPIDMITTSEVAVSLTIDDDAHLDDILEELNKYGSVEVDKGLAIVCVVGNFIAETKGHASEIFSSLQDVSIRMISYGGSKHNVSVLVKETDKEKALLALHKNMNE